MVTLKGPKGEVRTIKVGEEAVNLPQVKVGDLVTVKMYRVARCGSDQTRYGLGGRGENGHRQGQARRDARRNGCPADHGDGHRYGHRQEEGVPGALKGPDGNKVVAKAEDPKNLDKVKVGDELLITYTEALAISVEKTKKKIKPGNRKKPTSDISVPGPGNCRTRRGITEAVQFENGRRTTSD